MLEETGPTGGAALRRRVAPPPRRRSRGGALAIGLVVLAGVTSCGSDTDPEAVTATGTATATPTSEPTADAAGATPDPAALSDFDCAVDKRGRWNAVGRLTNTSGSTADFVVTVVVAGEESASADGLQQRITELSDGDSVELELSRLPVEATSGLTCRVQVLRRS